MDLTLISRYFDTRSGGAGSYSKLIYEGLKNKNINIQTISQENSFINKYNQIAYLFFIAIDLKRLIPKYKSDIYHALTPLESLYLPKNKSVTTVLDFIPLNETDTFISSQFAKLFNKSIKSTIECEQIIAENSDLKVILNEQYGAELDKITVIPPPIDSNYSPIAKTTKFLSEDELDDTFVIGTISNLMKRKRVDILVKSFLEADIENSKLLIGGRGSELEHLKELSKNDERIEFLGFVGDEDMNDFYNSLDVFAFPTAIEGYGMPMVEAMACGKPVITLDDSDIPSNIKDRTIVTTKDELKNVLINQDFKCDIESNIEFYKEHSIENISSKLMNIYEKI